MRNQQKRITLLMLTVVSFCFLLTGTVWLGRISVKDKSPEPKNNLPNSSQEIQHLKTELNSVKSELSQSNINQKKQLENKLSNIENKIKILANQDKSIIQELEKEIKEIKEKIKNDKPDENLGPGNKKEGEFSYKHFVREENVGYYVFDNIPNVLNRDWKIFHINQNHPRIKELLSQGKLKEDKLKVCLKLSN